MIILHFQMGCNASTPKVTILPTTLLALANERDFETAAVTVATIMQDQ